MVADICIETCVYLKQIKNKMHVEIANGSSQSDMTHAHGNQTINTVAV